MSFNKLFAYLARRGKIDAYKEENILFTTEDVVKKILLRVSVCAN
jgi:hypothetical protein